VGGVDEDGGRERDERGRDLGDGVEQFDQRGGRAAGGGSGHRLAIEDELRRDGRRDTEIEADDEQEPGATEQAVVSRVAPGPSVLAVCRYGDRRRVASGSE